VGNYYDRLHMINCRKELLEDFPEREHIRAIWLALNANILKDFVDFTAFNSLKEIGIKYTEDHPRSTPIPWFTKHVDTSKKQTALQENESTNYVIGVMSDSIDYNELPEL